MTFSFSPRARALALFVTLYTSSAFAGSSAPVRSFGDFTSLVTSQNLTSVEQVLSHLDAELLGNYSIGHASRSNQAASLTAPRVILFSARADFLLTFNGHGQQRGGSVMEVIAYDPVTKRPEFGSIDFTGGRARVSTAREARLCLQCHSSHPANFEWSTMEAHPIWDTYPNWPDRFGADHGTRTYSPEMENLWANFKRLAREHPRYRFLRDLQDKTLIQMGDLNNRLGDQLFDRNAEKAFSYVTKASTYPVLAEAWRSISKAAFNLPPSMTEIFEGVRARYHAEVMAGMDAYGAAKLARVNALSHDPSSPFVGRTRIHVDDLVYGKKLMADFAPKEAREATRLRFLLEQSHLSPELFNLTKEANSWAFSQGSRYLYQLVPILEKLDCHQPLVSQPGR